MPPVQAGAPTPFPNALPWTLIRSSAASSSLSQSFENGNFNWIYVVTGIDVTASQSQPVQCFFSASLTQTNPGYAPFYYDSQSTGEGLGVWFSWRGALPLRSGDVLTLLGTSVASIQWSMLAYGLRLPSTL